MSYSTAKKILRKFKKELRTDSIKKEQKLDLPKATFKQIEHEPKVPSFVPVMIVSTVAGIFQGSSSS